MVQIDGMSRQKRASLSVRQQKFIDEYVASNGNGTQAARKAGYKPGKVLGQQAHENLRKPEIISAINAKLTVLDVDYGPNRVKRRLHEISHSSEAAGQFGPAVRSEELLGKAAGMWIDASITLTGNMNDTAVAALIEIARKRQAEPIDLADDQPRDEPDRR